MYYSSRIGKMTDNHRALFLTVRLLSTIVLFSDAFGQQVGVSLQLLGQTIPNNSLVNLADLLYRLRHSPEPTNDNGLQTLMCVTDREDCCETPPLGIWYYPNGSIVGYNRLSSHVFQSNRGQHETINGNQTIIIYGSVRIWNRYTPPATERGRFHCELPDANGINHSLYVNILLFSPNTNSTFSVIMSSSGSSTAGETFSLTCSATLYPNQNPSLPDPSIPSPTFEWLYGPDGNASLPSGLTPGATTFNGSTYTSKLEFSPLHQSFTGNYTCRLGAGNLVNSNTLTVTVPSLNLMVTIATNFTTFLKVGQTGNALTCEVSGAERFSPMITYQWTRNNLAVSDGNLKTLNLSPLQLSHAGSYACNVNVSSALLSSSISASSRENQNVTVQIPDPQLVTLTSSDVLIGADVTINCILEFGQLVMESELSLLMVDVQLSRKGIYTMRNLSDSNPLMTGTILTYSTVVNSFSRSDSGNYSCVVTTRPHPNLEQPSSFYLNGTGKSVSIQTLITTGVFFSLKGSYVSTNSNIFITDIGEGDCGALLCYTDLNECCHDSNTTTRALGQWFYPNGSDVGTWSSGQDFYIDRGPSVVRLNRRTNATSTIIGLFCCVLPDATFTKIKICINVTSTAAPQSKQMVTCTTEVAIGAAVAVVAIVIVECLIIGAPITVVLLCKFCLKRRKCTCDSRLATREFNEKDDHELSNKAATASNAVQGCRVKEITEPDLNKTTISKSVNTQDDEDYEVMNTQQGDKNIYAVPDIATTMRGSGLGRREDVYYDDCDSAVSTFTPATIAMQPRGGESESGLHLYEDPDNPGCTTFLRGKFGLH